jgi:hypothetical protein
MELFQYFGNNPQSVNKFFLLNNEEEIIVKKYICVWKLKLKALESCLRR